MTFLTKFKEHLSKHRERKSWRYSDYSIAVIKLNDSEQVYGCVRNGLGRLERIPKPETGYHYYDIVEVEGPVGTQILREDEINEFRAIKIHRKSNRPTYTFEAILPDKKDYFYLLQEFEDLEQKSEFPWSSIDNNQEWRRGYCTANNIKQAEYILTTFCQKKNDRKVKNIECQD